MLIPPRLSAVLLAAPLAASLVLAVAPSSQAASIPGADDAPQVPATLGYAQVEGYWVAAGGPSSVARTAAAIAAAESDFEPGAIQAGQPYASTGWGLWQITSGNSAPSSFGSDFQLLDPWNNAEAAVWKYNQQGFGAWSTYTNGAYKAHMQKVGPDTDVTDPGQFTQVGAAPVDTPDTPEPDPGSTFGPGMPDGSSESSGAAYPVRPRHTHRRYAAAVADDTLAGLADRFADGRTPPRRAASASA